MVSLQAGIHINFVMGLNRLLKTHCIPWGVDLFCQLTRCQDGDMQPCKHKKTFIYRYHGNVYNLYSLWLNSKLIIVVLLFNRDFYLKKKPVKYIQEYIAKLSFTDSASVKNFFINSKLYTLQKNLTRVHLWGTFARHWRQVTRVGHCGLSIKINAGIWLVGDTDTPWQWGVNWMETQFFAIFLLSKKGIATSIFNNSPALYKNICSTCVQIFGELSVWTPKLCFSEVRKYVVKVKS